MSVPTALKGSGPLTPLLAIGVVAVFVAVLYSSSFLSLAALWQQNDYRYGALVFPIAGFLLWRSRASLARVTLEPWIMGIGVLAVLVLVWVLSRAVGVRATEQLAAVLMIPAAVATFLGASLAKRALFPLLFLVVAVPVGEVLIPHLMTVTADVSAALLRVAGVPVFRQGQFMSLPGGNFEIADVCSGLRYFIAGTMIALLYAYLTFSSNLKRVAFVSIAAAALILANGVRAFVTMYVASATNLEYFVGPDHVYFGWVLFAAVIMTLFWGGARFADVPAAVDELDVGSSTPARQKRSLVLLSVVLALAMLVITVQPFQRTLAERGWIFVILTAVLLAPVLYLQRRGGFSIATATLARAQGGFLAPGPLAVLLAGAVVLAAGPVWSTTSASPASGASAASPQLPDVADCSADSGAFEAWSKPSVKNTDFVVERTYACSGQPVRVFVAGYSNSTQGREFGNGIAQIMPMEQSVTVEQRTTFARADGRVTKVAEVQVERAPAEQYLIWYWFALGDGTATTGAGAKLAQAYQLIAHGRSDARLYVLATPAAEDATEARRVLSTVSAAVYAAIESSAAESVVQPDRS